MTIGDLNGRSLAVASVLVPGYSTVAKFLDQIVSNVPNNHVGPVVVRATHSIFTTGLRFNGTTVISIAPAAQLP